METTNMIVNNLSVVFANHSTIFSKTGNMKKLKTIFKLQKR